MSVNDPRDVTPAAGAVTDGPEQRGLSLRAYARHRNTSAPSVLRAIRSGRLSACLIVDAKGKQKIANVALADQEWEANTDLSRAPGYVKERPARSGKTIGPASVGSSAPLSPLAEASAEEKRWKAKSAELEYRDRAKQLVRVEEATRVYLEEIARAKQKLLAIPSKFKARSPHQAATDIRLLEQLLQDALEELAADTATQGAA